MLQNGDPEQSKSNETGEIIGDFSSAVLSLQARYIGLKREKI
jgi:hypothetical protein